MFVPNPVKLSKPDVQRALVRHHFAPRATQMDAYDRLRSIQFDPIAPVGCNHDLVLQARVPNYKIGDWQKPVYEDRLVYDGWDKQASLVPMEGWPVRRVLHERHKLRSFRRIFDDHADAVEAILNELQERGPLMPKECKLQEYKARSEIVPVEVEGMKAHATPSFLSLLDQPSLEPRVVFVAPLDQLMWDRRMIAHVFGFDYVWEIYVPEVKRRWGYYVLPVLFGDSLVARAEFNCRNGVLELREWHFEQGDPGSAFWPALERSVKEFMQYCSATGITVKDHIDPKVGHLFRSLRAV